MTNFPVSPSWSNEDQVKRLAELWTAGYSASQVRDKLHKEFGAAHTRNAIIGKVSRMGLSGPNAPVRMIPAKPAKFAAPKRQPTPKGKMVLPSYGGPTQANPQENAVASAVANAQARQAAKVVPLPEAPGTRTILTVRTFECRWPIGDPQNPDFALCGVKCVGVYCDRHSRRAYASHVTRERVDERLGIKVKVAA